MIVPDLTLEEWSHVVYALDESISCCARGDYSELLRNIALKVIAAIEAEGLEFTE